MWLDGTTKLPTEDPFMKRTCNIVIKLYMKLLVLSAIIMVYKILKLIPANYGSL